MLATQMPDTPSEATDVKRIKDKLAHSLKALQKRYVTSDAVVTSEDSDANLLCCALEAIFIHGIKNKYIRFEVGGQSRKRDRGPLPQPFFWSLLKTVTHRDVIRELEKINFVGTDVGRCRAWLRLALNHGLLECYLASLFREDSKLRAHYQPSALLLNTEEREVLLSYLQGLASLTFNLSYKSAVLNQWTTTPLALSGLCPLLQADALDLPLNGGDLPTSKSMCKELWDTMSQSSGSSDTQDMQRGCPVLLGKASNVLQGGETTLNSSNLSLETTGSSQLSSSLSSDSLLQGQDPRSPTGEQWSSSDLDTPNNISTKRPQKNSLTDFRESGHCSQDSMREDSFFSSTGLDQYSEAAIFSASDSDAHGPPMPSQDQPPNSILSDSEPPPTLLELSPSDEDHVNLSPSEVCISASFKLDTVVLSPACEIVEGEVHTASVQESNEPVLKERVSETSDKSCSEPSVQQVTLRSTSILSRVSSDSFSNSRCWISEEDIYKPHLEEMPDSEEGPPSPTPEPKTSQLPPSVIHRRQIGLSNPFRGLLKLGHLERRGAMGLWRDYYCELSPTQFSLYLSAEEQTCYDNCFLVRCEDVRIMQTEGRFELTFSGKRMYLRAANHDEAEDWVDRIAEAVNKCRPASRIDDQWEVLHPCSENGVEVFSASSAPSSPEWNPSSLNSRTCAGQDALPPQEFDWTRTADLETDAIKEAVLYYSTDPEARTWVPLVFSLSLEALKGFHVKEGRKLLRQTYPIEEIRDVVPDVSSGGPSFFKLLTVRETLRLRAENAEEACSWRDLIRGALDSYLESESGEDGASGEQAVVLQGVAGNLRRLVQHRLKEDGALLAHLYTVPSEKGLYSQNFICAGCPQQIGPSLGRARLCHFSGQYYCHSCHRGDTTTIPSRMVHNWDLTPREVSKKALRLLACIEQEPLLNLEQLNPDLMKHADYMAQTNSLRQRLRLLGDYLLTCRSGACKKLHARMEQRTYLLESSQLYSVMDLRQIAEGQYANYLMTLSQYASKHVYHCDLCTQRGFICQICRSDDIIFPFQFESTTRCKVCKTVFHLACKAPCDSCPRCQRMRRYLERDLQD